MKIGIVTFYYAHNYGAVLQAYALKTYLEKFDNNVRMCPHLNKNITSMYERQLQCTIPKKFFLNPFKWKLVVKEIKKIKWSKDEWRLRYDKFDDFIKTELLDKDIILKDPDKFDMLFFGSDQIWEQKLIGNDLFYFGYTDLTDIKIAYAASCFTADTYFSDEMIQGIKSFDMISVREEKIANKISTLTNKHVDTVCDPGFLLKEEAYYKLTEEENRFGDFVLFYFVAEDYELSKLVEYFRAKLNKKVIEVHYYKYREEHEDYIIDCGPKKFLTLIRYASFVFTNSFHGASFSIIMKKNFWVKSNNMRLINLLDKFGLKNRLITHLEISKKNNLFECIDYNKISKCYDNFVDLSKAYINRALEIMEQYNEG